MWKNAFLPFAVFLALGNVALANKCSDELGRSPFEEIDGPHGSKRLIFVVPTDLIPVKDGRVEFLVTLPKHRRTLDGFKVDGKTYQTAYFRDGIIMLENGQGSYIRHPNTDPNPGTGDLLIVNLILFDR